METLRFQKSTRRKSRATFVTGLGDGLGTVTTDPRVGGRVFGGPLGFAAYSAQEVLGSTEDLIGDPGMQGQLARAMAQRFFGISVGNATEEHQHVGGGPLHGHEGGNTYHEHD